MALSSFYPVVAGRTSDALSRYRSLYQVQVSKQGIQQLENQLSSGKRFDLPSQDPTAAIRVIGIQRDLEFRDQTLRNLDSSQGYLNVTESTLANFQDTLTEIRGLGVESAGNVNSEEERAGWVSQIDATIERLTAAANTRYQDRYLFAGGRVDALMMRFVDIMYALPYILFVIILVVIFGRNPVLLFVGIGCLEWLTMARIVRGQTLSLKQREFIEAAKAGGAKPLAIILRHIVPNLTGPVVIYATLTIPEIIATESFLSYLGLGVQEPQTSLGTLISQGSGLIESLPWMLISPAVVLVTMLAAFIYLGDGLRDALDPKDR